MKKIRKTEINIKRNCKNIQEIKKNQNYLKKISKNYNNIQEIGAQTFQKTKMKLQKMSKIDIQNFLKNNLCILISMK